MSTRRQFLRTASAAALAAQAPAQSRPNVLFIFSDQHRQCSMPGEEHNDAEAPTLARLASEGVSLTQCISNYPVCSPYRGILMSGKWPYESGVIDNAFPLKLEDLSLGEAFQRSGYRTGYVGKWHLDARGTEGKALKPAGEARHGFDDWMARYNTNPHFDKSYTFDRESGERKAPKGYNATRMTDDAVGFIKRNRAQPWMLTVSWNPPHPPFLDAPPELMKKYEPGAMKLRPNTGETVERLGVAERSSPVRPNLAGYNAHIEGVDIEMARVLKTLEETGQADNTILVYTSDHGEMLGSHGRMGKRLPHDESCRVPFIVRAPGIAPAGKTSDVQLSTIDIYPTLCGLAGIDVPDHCRGRDLSAAFRGERVIGPENVFIMHIDKAHASGGRNHPAPIFRGVRSGRFTYAVGEIGRWCLYDNVNDPYQQENLTEEPRWQGLMSDLDQEIVRYLNEAKDPYPFNNMRVKRTQISV